MSFSIGCAIWAYKGWLGDLFPSGSASSKFLQLYSQRFTTVECNATFYSVPSAATVARWQAQTPPGFEFCPKFPRCITHDSPLHQGIDAALNFIDLMQGLGDRLGPIFAQLPPSYSPASFADLETFFTGLQHCGTPLALEVRHPDWFKSPHAEKLSELLHRLQVGRVLLDSRPMYQFPEDPQLGSQRRKPNVPLQPVVTAPFSIIRYISHPTFDLNQPFLEDWVRDVEQWLQHGTRIYFFVHCPVEEHSPRTAQNFHHLLQQQQVPVPPLPWDQFAAEPQQLSLF
ncbi:hypothetical protein C1752_01740 [Acaryochloris thomasi RCC1774]|uniref:DUF72 domain-containing protein n=1 Tax=Acaryochloris thomasi RCC1774 TaxID=1764569 RepID=A0A2W1JR93_9CYAN|nr:DUF72 domain-containing protein [Acaryochloris thomasi]PZD73845.1 hypothetical protein C1752_01740 [Acaryochloris thomasi RCC1774]